MAALESHIGTVGERSSAARSEAIQELYEQINGVAKRWHASSLGVYDHQCSATIDLNELIHGWDEGGDPDSLILDAGTLFALEVQWGRLLGRTEASFDGPSVVHDGGNVALRYVAHPFTLSATYVVICLPSDAENASNCSLELDAVFSLANGKTHPGSVALSRRELEIARWVSEGKTSPEVAVILSLSEYTVNDYIRSGMKKMGATNRLSFIAKTIRQGLVA